ncbi:uncharacterized protein c19h1orf94 isoform X2 [Larimichthys crocea]|uniref:uncharacterized protein c19h1orf94 isoform X2 n=1 Tax=Larimichthys crocea TaxID=215358 RepID=UPI000902004F|nr:uncharacterized protein LOC104920417 isoform X2 [Larimichthys crocea]
MRANNREKMMPPGDDRMPHPPKRFVSAFAPFPRSTWIHPQVPNDNFDSVCETIWRRAKEAEEEFGRGRSSPERMENKDCPPERAEEQQKETDDLGLSIQHKDKKVQYHTDFILPCPYLSDHRHPHVAQSVWVLSPVMEVEMKRNEVEEKKKRNLQRDAEDKQTSVENSQKNNLVRRRDASETQPLLPNPISSATEEHTPYLQEKEDLLLLSKLLRDTCVSEEERNTSSRSDSNSSDNDNIVTLRGLRSYATDSSDDDSVSDKSDCTEEKKNEIIHSDELNCDSKQDFPSSSADKVFPPLSTIKAGILPRPTEPPALGKLHDQWEIPLSFHPHDNPTATLASGMTAHAQTPVQGKAKAPQANLKTSAPPTASMQQEAYNLLADFPELQPPKKPLALGVLRDGNPKTKAAEGKGGHAPSTNHRQEIGASHQRRMENVPHEVSSIWAGDQKTVLDPQTFGMIMQCKSPIISCEDLTANIHPPPRVAGTDGMGVNARSWANAAKAGMKQAAAPQEKARPFPFHQIVTINRAKVGCTAAQNFANKMTTSHHAASPLVTTCHGPRPRNPHRFVRPGNPHTHQQFGAWVHRANCPPGFRCPRFPFQQFGARAYRANYPPGFRCPRFPFQQTRGHPSKHSQV